MVKGIEVVREITYGYPWYSLRVIRQNRAEVAPRIERPCTYAIVVEPKATRDLEVTKKKSAESCGENRLICIAAISNLDSRTEDRGYEFSQDGAVISINYYCRRTRINQSRNRDIDTLRGAAGMRKSR